MKITVQDLIDKLNEIEDKSKTIVVSGLSYYGDFYSVSSSKVKVIEEDE